MNQHKSLSGIQKHTNTDQVKRGIVVTLTKSSNLSDENTKQRQIQRARESKGELYPCARGSANAYSKMVKRRV